MLNERLSLQSLRYEAESALVVDSALFRISGRLLQMSQKVPDFGQATLLKSPQETERLRVFSGLSPRAAFKVEWHSTCSLKWAGRSTMCAFENVAAASELPRSVKTIIREGGGEYVGIQRGVWQAGSPDLVLFNDPLTGTTLALAASAAFVTVQCVRTKIAESRLVFAAMRESGAYRESRQGDLPWNSSWSRGALCANQPA